MNLDFLDNSKPALGPEWRSAEIEYIGGQGYTLNKFEATVRIRCMHGGFRIEFRESLHVPADALLGRTIPWGYLTDIRVHTGGHILSLATLYPDTYPRKIRRGEIIGIAR